MSENHREPEVPEKSPSGRKSRWLRKDYIKGTCNNSFCEKWHLQNACSIRPRVVVGLGTSTPVHIVKLMNCRSKGPRRMITKVQVIGKKEDMLPTNVPIDRGNLIRWVIRSCDKIHLNVNLLMHGNWGMRISRHDAAEVLFSGSAQTCGNQSNVWNSRKPFHVTLKFETKILRSDIFVHVKIISAAPTLQNLRIGL